MVWVEEGQGRVGRFVWESEKDQGQESQECQTHKEKSYIHNPLTNLIRTGDNLMLNPLRVKHQRDKETPFHLPRLHPESCGVPVR